MKTNGEPKKIVVVNKTALNLCILDRIFNARNFSKISQNCEIFLENRCQQKSYNVFVNFTVFIHNYREKICSLLYRHHFSL